jgi:hypothetical protein
MAGIASNRDFLEFMMLSIQNIFRDLPYLMEKLIEILNFRLKSHIPLEKRDLLNYNLVLDAVQTHENPQSLKE